MLQLNINKKINDTNNEFNLDIKLKIEQNDFIAISGISGSGKTTLLRILVGLEKASGEIKLNGEYWLSDKINLAVQKREIGFVFQDYALFENMNVLENLLYVQKDKVLALKLLELTNLTSFQKRMPNSLSGGQKQRVAICRALMKKPKLLLLDEPLSALDIQMRKKLQDEILKLHKEFDTITILVSHDPSEIYKLANKVIVLDKGKIISQGSPKDVLLKTSGSMKFSFQGEILEIQKVDVIFIAIIAIGQQIVEVTLSSNEAKELKEGDKVNISTKAFSPIISKI